PHLECVFLAGFFPFSEWQAVAKAGPEVVAVAVGAVAAPAVIVVATKMVTMQMMMIPTKKMTQYSRIFKIYLGFPD
ncbi:hypothetical protein Tsubulata_044393, partial [Turnera subulata]